MAIQKLVEQVKGIPAYVKAHWKQPGEGEYLS